MSGELVLVDTSVWIEFFNRPLSREAQMVKELLEADRVALAGAVLTELIHGARSPKERELLARTLSILPFLEPDREDWLRAGFLLNDLRGRGLTLPVTDAILAQLCLRHRLALFSLDHHFNRIEGLLHFSLK